MPPVEFEETEASEQMWAVIKDGTSLRKVEIAPDDEDVNESEQALNRGLAMLKKEKGL